MTKDIYKAAERLNEQYKIPDPDGLNMKHCFVYKNELYTVSTTDIIRSYPNLAKEISQRYETLIYKCTEGGTYIEEAYHESHYDEKEAVERHKELIKEIKSGTADFIKNKGA